VRAVSARGLALVTGGAVRVGRGVVEALAAAGFDVAFSYHTSAAAAGEVASGVGRRTGRRVEAFPSDLRDPAAAPRLVAEVRARLGPLDVLVCSAASFRAEALPAVTPEGFDEQMALNVRAPLLLSRAAASELGRAGRGRIVMVADLSGERPSPGYLVHSATKAALLNLTQGLALELAPRVAVHAVVPGPVALPEGWTAGERAAELARTPAAREGSPADVGEAVVFLATCSPFLTGAVLHVDGGRHAWGG